MTCGAREAVSPMKLRILDDSIRLRLERSELVQLLRDGRVERRTRFGTSTFVYAIHAVEQSTPLRAACRSQRIDVYVDMSRAQAWATSEESSLEAVQREGDAALRLLIEKDFPCQHSPPKDVAEKFVPGKMRVEAGVAWK